MSVPVTPGDEQMIREAREVLEDLFCDCRDEHLAVFDRLVAWRKATMPIVAALAIYGEQASLPALVAKARELNEGVSR